MKFFILLIISPLCILFSRFNFLPYSIKHFLCYGLSEDREDIGQFRDYGNYTYCNYYSYFDDLVSNFGNNETNSTCCYVALGMLLTYYDCVFDEDIVGSSRSVYGSSSESFGTLFEPYSNITNENVGQYYNHIRTYKNSALHSYLILRNKNALNSNPASMQSTYTEEFGDNVYGMSSLAEDYLDNVAGYNGNGYQINMLTTLDGVSTYDDLVSFIDNEIYYGRPVWCGFDSHAVIIYGYSDNNYKYHNGYLDDIPGASRIVTTLKTNLFNNAPFSPSIFAGAFSIEFTNYSHHHAYNLTDDNITYYCICGAQQHIHDYTHHYVDNNANNHKSYCACGAYIHEVHDYLIYFFDNPCRCGRYR